ncbi:hypothetical protein FRC08_014097, partial [Ceratobasidium sp. 394]
MLLVLLATMWAGVALVVTSSLSFVRFVLNLSSEELLMCVQVGLIVYAIIFHVVFISHGSVFRSLARYAQAAFAKAGAAIIWLFSPVKFVCRAVYGIVILRVVVCFLLVFISCLVRLVVVSILKGFASVIRRATWSVFSRVVAPCILFALLAPIRLVCAACVYGCIAVTTLWMEVMASLLCVPLRWLTRLCEPWSVPPGSFVFAVDETTIWHNKRARHFRVFSPGKRGKSNIKLSIKQSLLRHEKYWDALDYLSDCTEPFATTNDAQPENDSKDSRDAISPVPEPCAVLNTTAAATPPTDAPKLAASPTLDLTAADHKNEPTECDQATSPACTTKDITSISEGQPEITSKDSKVIAPRASPSTILNSDTDPSFDSSSSDQDTANTSLTSTSDAILSPAPSTTSLAVDGDKKTRSEAPPASEPQATDKPEPIAESQPAAKSDTPIPPQSSAKPETTTEPKRVNKRKPPVKSRPPAPRKFKLPAKFNLSMSCDLFKLKAAPQPKSLNELPVQPRPCPGVMRCSCESNRDALPLTAQMEKLQLYLHEPEPEIQETTKNVETPVVESAIESRPSDTADVGVQTVTTAIETAESDARVTGSDFDVPNIVVTAEDEADASTGETVDTTDTTTTYANTAGTPARDMPTTFEGPLGVPSMAADMQAAPPATGSDYISPFDAFLAEGPMTDFPSSSGAGSNFQIGGSDARQPSHFDWPGANVNGMGSESGFTGAPMMGGIPNMEPGLGPVPGLNLDFLAELPK